MILLPIGPPSAVDCYGGRVGRKGSRILRTRFAQLSPTPSERIPSFKDPRGQGVILPWFYQFLEARLKHANLNFDDYGLERPLAMRHPTTPSTMQLSIRRRFHLGLDARFIANDLLFLLLHSNPCRRSRTMSGESSNP